VGLNLTCSNVTVQNLRIIGWQAGVLGIFNNDTVKNNFITQCDSGLKLYAQYYVIIGNAIERNNEAIRIGVGGVGGLHFIANNNIANNKIGFSIYDSGNAIIQNNITDSSDCAIILDNIAWNQTVYHNNFIDNKKAIADYTYSSTPDRPLQSAVQPWDNGSSGNYWSNYNGTDGNGDGIGDSPNMIPTYYRDNVLSFYSFVDRYPLMTEKNIAGAIPSIPQALIPVINTQTNPSPENKAKALSFLKDIFLLDLNKYTTTLLSEQISTSNSDTSESFRYSLHNGFANSVEVTLAFSNTTLTACNLNLQSGSLLTTYQFSNKFDTAKTIMHNYRA
jgi:hypothetical protein